MPQIRCWYLILFSIWRISKKNFSIIYKTHTSILPKIGLFTRHIQLNRATCRLHNILFFNKNAFFFQINISFTFGKKVLPTKFFLNFHKHTVIYPKIGLFRPKTLKPMIWKSTLLSLNLILSLFSTAIKSNQLT